MAIADSRNDTLAAPVFIETEPDWGQEYRYGFEFRTDMLMARNDAEQRARRRERPLYAQSYVSPNLEPITFGVRRAQAIKQLGAPVVVPIWRGGRTLAGGMTSTDVAELSISLTGRGFKAGSYAYFVESGLTSVFRKIVSVGSTSITLASGDSAYPSGTTPPSYTTAATVYPCIRGMREENSARFQGRRIDRGEEEITVIEL